MRHEDELIMLRGLVEQQYLALKQAEGFISHALERNGFGHFTLKYVRTAIQNTDVVRKSILTVRRIK